MTHIPDSQLTLYAGGELDEPEALQVASHLVDCANCRKKADEFRAAAEWLRSVAAEPDAGQIYRLRESVLQTVAHRPRWKPFAWLAAAAASLALIFFAPAPFRPAQKEPAAAAVELPPIPAGRASLGPLILPSRHWHRAVRHVEPKLTLFAKNNEGLPVVRVKTSDPNVVILWVVSGGSEQERNNE